MRAIEQRLGFRLRDERQRRYGELVGDVGEADALAFPEDSLLEDAAAYALGETAPSA